MPRRGIPTGSGQGWVARLLHTTPRRLPIFYVKSLVLAKRYPCENRLQRRLEAVLTGRNRPGSARTFANRAGTVLMGALRTGLEPAACPLRGAVAAWYGPASSGARLRYYRASLATAFITERWRPFVMQPYYGRLLGPTSAAFTPVTSITRR